MAKEYRCYKPNKQKQGSASSWQIGEKKGKFGKVFPFFISITKQAPENDDRGNNKFFWDRKLVVNINEEEIAQFINMFSGVTKEIKLYHQSPNGSNKLINAQFNEQYNNFYLHVSQKDKEGNQKKVGHSINMDEARVISIIMNECIRLTYTAN